MTAAHPYRTKTVGMRTPKLLGHGIDAPPLALPVAGPRPFSLTDPVFARSLDAAGQLPAQHSIVEGIVGLGTVAFGFELLDHSHRYVRPLLRAQPVHKMLEELQPAPPRC